MVGEQFYRSLRTVCLRFGNSATSGKPHHQSVRETLEICTISEEVVAVSSKHKKANKTPNADLVENNGWKIQEFNIFEKCQNGNQFGHI